jgi:hypothetical protein
MTFALASGALTAGPLEAASCSVVGQKRSIGGRTQICTRIGNARRWVPATNKSGTTTTTTVRTSTSTTTLVDVVKPGLPRSTVDRPGPASYDVKFIYATFVDGPDERRDSNGAIAGIATDVNRYFRTQFPGHQARYDTFDGRLDVQYVQIPVTNKAFRSYFVDDGYILEDLLQSVLNKAGLDWTHGMHEDIYGHNKRFYFMFVEGYRGVKWGPDSESYEYECTITGRVSAFDSCDALTVANARVRSDIGSLPRALFGKVGRILQRNFPRCVVCSIADCAALGAGLCSTDS